MFLLSEVFQAHRVLMGDAFTCIFLFDDSIFSNTVFLLHHSSDLTLPASSQILRSIETKLTNTSNSVFLVESVTIFIASEGNNAIRLSSNGIEKVVKEYPKRLVSQLSNEVKQSHAPREVYSITQLICSSDLPSSLHNLIMHDAYLCEFGFKLINEKSGKLLSFDYFSPETELRQIETKRLQIDDMINRKLHLQNGKLKGIRADYIYNDISYYDEMQICMLYRFSDIGEYERKKRLEFLDKTSIASTSTISHDRNLDQGKVSNDTKLSTIKLPSRFYSVLNFLEKSGHQSLSVHEFLHLNSHQFDIERSKTSEVHASYLGLKKYFHDILKNNKNSECFETSYSRCNGSNRAGEQNLNSDFKKSRPDDICIGDWEDILSVISKTFPNDEVDLKLNLELQIRHFYKVLDIKVVGAENKLRKIKETADWLFPGNFVEQFSYINAQIIEQQLLPKSKRHASSLVKYEKGKNTEINLGVPIEVSQNIIACADECYFDDKKMHQIFIEEQTSAYEELQSISFEGMQDWILESIKDFVSSKYVDDYTGQLTEVKVQIKSYAEIESVRHPHDLDSLRELKQQFRLEFPGNYKRQLKLLKEALIESESARAQDNEIIEKSIELNRLKPDIMEPLRWEALLNSATNNYADDLIGQEDYVKTQLSNYYNICKITAPNFETEIQEIRVAAESKYGTDYSRQLQYIDKELKMLTECEAQTEKTSRSLLYKDNSDFHEYSTTEPVLDIENKPYLQRITNDIVNKFNEQNQIIIEVNGINSFDAFEYELINNKIIITINSSHSFYKDIYLHCTVEQQAAIKMMISSLCDLSSSTISEKLRAQDRKLFSRWSEYIEQWLAKE